MTRPGSKCRCRSWALAGRRCATSRCPNRPGWSRPCVRYCRALTVVRQKVNWLCEPDWSVSSGHRLRSSTLLFISCWSGWLRQSRVCVFMAACLMTRRLCRHLLNNTRWAVQIFMCFYLKQNVLFIVQFYILTALIVLINKWSMLACFNS